MSHWWLAVLLTTLVGCASHQERPAQVSVNEAPFAMIPGWDDYVYYPDYGVYYSSHQHEYAYRSGNEWVMRPAPLGLPIHELQATPAVQMNFRPSPTNHQVAVPQPDSQKRKEKTRVEEAEKNGLNRIDH